ncbi:phage head closure protein [Rummeliibacillus sp. NPDC094406]|uniref:phage head closure protein n=1 Tax=Rummeliibacillus sp. NPDC094406 TaxID=3364511 RepID=UPI00382B041C
MNDEFPRLVEIYELVQGEEDDSGGFGEDEPKTLFQMMAFVDTPTSQEQYTAMQMQNPLDRFMYYPYRKDVLETHFVLCDDDKYKIAGKPEDQGGMHEIMRVPLKLVKK